MTRRQQIVLGAVGALLLATLVMLLVLSSDGGDEEVTAGSTTTTASVLATSTTTSTTALATTTLLGVTTTVPPGSTAPTPPGTTRPAPVVTGAGAVLSAIPGGEVRTLPPGVGCEGLASTGWDPECGSATAKGARLVWLVETSSVPDGSTARRASVFRDLGGQRYRLELRSRPDTASRFSEIRVQVVDVSGDGAAEIAFGFRIAADDGLAVDLVEGPGVVVVHRSLALGRARVSPGQLDTWRAVTPGGSTYTHEVTQYHEGAWRLVGSDDVRGSDVPPSQL